jgi:hypothetical protein
MGKHLLSPGKEQPKTLRVKSIQPYTWLSPPVRLEKSHNY